MNIIRLRFFKQLPILLAMDHPTMHRYSLGKNSIKKTLYICLSHGVDAALRQGQVDGFGEVERYSGGISEIYAPLLIENEPLTTTNGGEKK
jgi:hypothetical protein